MDPGGQLQLLLNVANDQKIVSYFHVMAATVFVYDYCLTFGMEMRHIWPSRWNAMKTLYIIQRYMPFADTVFLILHRQFMWHPSPTYCSLTYQISGWMFTAGMAVSEIILTLRAWAVWHRSTFLGVLLPAYFILCIAPGIYVEQKFLESLKFGPSPFETPGCFVTDAKSSPYLAWVLLMAYESALLLLMIISAIQQYRSRNPFGTLVTTVYADGILYFIYLFTLSVVNVVVIKVLPADMGDTLASLERVMYSILSSRVVLHIREQAQKASPKSREDFVIVEDTNCDRTFDDDSAIGIAY